MLDIELYCGVYTLQDECHRRIGNPLTEFPTGEAWKLSRMPLRPEYVTFSVTA